MNRTIVSVLIGLVIIGGGIAVLVTSDNKNDQATTSSSGSKDDTMQNMPESSAPQSNSSSSSEIASGSVDVEIKDFAYSQKTLKVKKGTKVTWTNRDSVKHDVVPDSQSESFKKSDLLSNGESYNIVFDTVGSFVYHCSVHPNMKASVEVVE